MHIELRDRTVFVGNGGRAKEGAADWRGGGTPRLLLWHGAGMDRTVWVLLARYFARHGVDVIVPDLPGHGASGGEPLPDIESMADWGIELIEALCERHGLGDGPLLVAGHSMGSLLALELAGRLARRDEPPAALWLLGSNYPMNVTPVLLEAARLDSPVAIDIIATYGHAYASRLGHNDVAGISVHNMARALLRRADPGVLHTDLEACRRYEGGERAAAGLQGCPVQLIVGDEDRMTPPRAAQALAGLTGADVHRIVDCGHMMMSEQPERVLATMRSLLATALRSVPERVPA